jgi:sterol desaturase/sphingolipid hydroxylase (fatty acid hydroxylase superfamily)
MYSLLKSEVGPYPQPSSPPSGTDPRAEDRRARGRLYPVTIVYFTYLAVLTAFAIRSGHGLRALVWALPAIPAWTLMEYMSHRYMMHVAFPRGKRWLSRLLHFLFDASHADHHARPWDGFHINGHLDTMMVFVVVAPLSLLAPPYTVSIFVAVFFCCYVVEEWLHHSMHFWNIDSTYLQYVRRRHLYHHSRHGVGVAYGITSGIWDTVFGTRIPEADRIRLRRGSSSAPIGPV